MPAERTPAPLGGDEWIAVALIVLVAAATGVWCGAQLATLLTTAHFLDASIGDALGAMFRLPKHLSAPAEAWPPEVQASVPGPFVYWPATMAVFAGQITSGVWLWLRFGASRIGTQRRRRLGVDVGARLATRKDLAPLIVEGPTPGRFILGVVGGRLVATESRTAPATAGRRGGRRGDRSAVAVIG
ncbi:MAG: type IV secretory system conjugative DNA transfer family protein, partial [Acidimicrobiales bacterium]